LILINARQPEAPYEYSAAENAAVQFSWRRLRDMETEKIKCLVAVTALMLCSVGNAHAADRFESLINSFQVLCTLEAPVFEWIDQKAMAMNLAVRIHDLQHAAVSNRKVRPRYAYLSPFLKQSSDNRRAARSRARLRRGAAAAPWRCADSPTPPPGRSASMAPTMPSSGFYRRIDYPQHGVV
jgi:hypothetical protein